MTENGQVLAKNWIAAYSFFSLFFSSFLFTAWKKNKWLRYKHPAKDNMLKRTDPTYSKYMVHFHPALSFILSAEKLIPELEYSSRKSRFSVVISRDSMTF